MRKATLVAALLLLTPAVSQAKTLEELLVEKGVITKGEAAGASDSSASKLYWNQGTRVEFPDNGFTTSIATMLQTRYSFNDRDEEPTSLRRQIRMQTSISHHQFVMRTSIGGHATMIWVSEWEHSRPRSADSSTQTNSLCSS
jgi:hypothetical protein